MVNNNKMVYEKKLLPETRLINNTFLINNTRATTITLSAESQIAWRSDYFSDVQFHRRLARVMR